MQYDNLPDWKKVSDKVYAGVSLDPVEQFIYDEEPSGYEGGVWRTKLQAALYFFGGAPPNSETGDKSKAAEFCPVCNGCGVIKEKTPVGSWTDKCKKCNGTGKSF